MALVQEVDLGWRYATAPSPARIHLYRADGIEVPSGELLRERSSTRGLGGFGFIDEECAQYRGHATSITRFVEDRIDHESVIILPEFSTGPKLTTILEAMIHGCGKRCILVGGSYYQMKDHRRVASVCPVIVPGQATIFQEKFYPSPAEVDYGMVPPASPVLYRFKNSGFGDFAVLVCSDGLRRRLDEWEVEKPLTGRIDLLVVIARNKSSRLTTQLQDLADERRWIVAYCNGLRNPASQVITPYGKGRLDPRSGLVEIDLAALATDIAAPVRPRAQGRPSVLRSRTATMGFAPAPRHSPYSSGRGLRFAKNLKVLAIGSHFDDIWLGCAGTLMLLQEWYDAEVFVVNLCTAYPHPYYDQYEVKTESLDKVVEKLTAQLGFRYVPVSKLIAEESRDGDKKVSLIDRDFSTHAVKAAIARVAETYFDADTVFIPRRDDHHQDHSLTAQAALVQFRRSDMFEYEIKGFRRTPFQHNFLVDLNVISRKSLTLNKVTFKAGDTIAQKKAWICENAFRRLIPVIPDDMRKDRVIGRMALRAQETGPSTPFAEAFATELIV